MSGSTLSLAEATAWRTELLEAQAYTVLSLEALQRAGVMRFGSAEAISLYGMSPRACVARSLQIVGRTAIEAKVDSQAGPIAEELKQALAGWAPFARLRVVDLFTGSGNLLYHVVQATGAADVLAFERDATIHGLTQGSFDALGFPVQVQRGDHRDHLGQLFSEDADCTVFLLDVPWGNQGAFSFDRGLDLRRTTPPVRELLDVIKALWPAADEARERPSALYVVPIYKRTDASSILDFTETYPLLQRGLTPTASTQIGYIIGSIA